ncbi:exported hypothetical protein [Gammaproteobacteria bacterium]
MKRIILASLLYSISLAAISACPKGMSEGMQIVQASGANDGEASANLQQQINAYQHFEHFQITSSETRISNGKHYKTSTVTYCRH